MSQRLAAGMPKNRIRRSPNFCQKLASRRRVSRRPSRLLHSRLDWRRAACEAILYSAQPARRSEQASGGGSQFRQRTLGARAIVAAPRRPYFPESIEDFDCRGQRVSGVRRGCDREIVKAGD